jgi:hypothetical protein
MKDWHARCGVKVELKDSTRFVVLLLSATTENAMAPRNRDFAHNGSRSLKPLPLRFRSARLAAHVLIVPLNRFVKGACSPLSC